MTPLFGPVVRILKPYYAVTSSERLLDARGRIKPRILPGVPIEAASHNIWSPGYMHYVTKESDRQRLISLGAERRFVDGVELWCLPKWNKNDYPDGTDLATELEGV
jgi:hypothetical protein